MLALGPPAAGAEVMGTAIVSIALSLDGHEGLSRVLLAIAVARWLMLAVLAPLRAARDPAGFRADARTPAALTAPVATCVVGVRLTLLGWSWAGIATLAIAFALWAALLAPVARGWKVPTVGVSLLLAVSAEALAVLAATLAAAEHARWLLIAAIAAFAAGLGLYALVLARFDLRQLATGRGDQWITGGALAISALAAARIAGAAPALGVLADHRRALADTARWVWVLSALWVPVLVAAEARWPRLRYDARRWSTVFPLGMYAASGFVVGRVAGAGTITDIARVTAWIALAAWAIVAALTVREAAGVLRGRGGPSHGSGRRRRVGDDQHAVARAQREVVGGL